MLVAFPPRLRLVLVPQRVWCRWQCWEGMGCWLHSIDELHTVDFLRCWTQNSGRARCLEFFSSESLALFNLKGSMEDPIAFLFVLTFWLYLLASYHKIPRLIFAFKTARVPSWEIFHWDVFRMDVSFSIQSEFWISSHFDSTSWFVGMR